MVRFAPVRLTAALSAVPLKRLSVTPRLAPSIAGDGPYRHGRAIAPESARGTPLGLLFGV